MQTTDFISLAIIAFVVPVVLNWMSKGARVPAEIKEGKAWLTYGPVFKGFGLFSLVFPLGGVAVIIFLEGGPESPWGFLFYMLFFSSISAALILEAFFVKIGVDDHTVYCFSPWRKNRVISRTELGEPVYNENLQWWVIPTERSGKIRIQDFIRGKEVLLAEDTETV